MIRLLGAITGSALALAALLLLVGIPQFKTQSADIERQTVTLPLPSAPVEEPGDAAQDVIDTVAAAPVPPAAAVSDNADDADVDEAWDIPPLEEIPPEEPTVAHTGTEPHDETDAMTQWYAFWSPFRSEIAASGFISRLQSVTGLDYRVVKIKPGVYEVAFAYDDDQEIPTSLSQITAATGLNLPEG